MKLIHIILIVACSALRCSGEEETNGKTISSSYSYSLEYNDGDSGNFGHKVEVKDGTAKVNVQQQNPKKYYSQSATNLEKHSANVVETSTVATGHKNYHYEPQAQNIQAPLQKYSREQLAVLLAQNKNPFLPLDSKYFGQYSASQTTQPQSNQYYNEAKYHGGQAQQVYYQPQTQNAVQYVYLPQNTQHTSQAQIGPVQFNQQNSAHNSEQNYIPNYNYNQVQPNTYGTQEKQYVASNSDQSRVQADFLQNNYKDYVYKQPLNNQVAYSKPKAYIPQNYHYFAPQTPVAQHSAQNLDYQKLVQYVPSSQASAVTYKSSETVQPSAAFKYSNIRAPDSGKYNFAALYPQFKYEPTSEYLTIPHYQGYHPQKETSQNYQGYQPQNSVSLKETKQQPEAGQLQTVQINDNKHHYGIGVQRELGGAQKMVQTNYNEHNPAPAATDHSNVRYVYVPTYVPYSGRDEHENQ